MNNEFTPINLEELMNMIVTLGNHSKNCGEFSRYMDDYVEKNSYKIVRNLEENDCKLILQTCISSMFDKLLIIAKRSKK